MPFDVDPTDRAPLPDIARAFALIGIILVNVQIFSHPLDLTYAVTGFQTHVDRWISALVDTFFVAKSFALFSFLFGAGLGFQMKKARAEQAALGPRYARRMMGLLLMGFLHAALLFVGDILVLYAVLGSALYFCRNWPTETLVRGGLICLFMQAGLLYLAGVLTLLTGLIAAEPSLTLENKNPQIQSTIEIYQQGSFLETTGVRIAQWPEVFLGLLLTQGFAVFGYFLLGLAGMREGLIEDTRAQLWSMARQYGLPIGIGLNVLGGVLYASAESPLSAVAVFAHAIIFTGAPFLAAGYLGLIALLAGRASGWLLRALALAGSASLSAYLLQSFLLSFLFNGYGFGLYGRLGAATCIALALAAGLFSLSALAFWRHHFHKGPAEISLRWFTYGRSTAKKVR